MSAAAPRLIAALQREGLFLSSDAPPDVTGISADSRSVVPGNWYVAVRGSQADGHRFAASAVERGASAIVVEERLPLAVPQVLVRDGRLAALALAKEWFGNPAAQLTLIGVTGTNGKTTTTALVRHLFNADGTAGSIGTLGAFDGAGDAVPSTAGSLTTPGPVDLQATLAELVRRGTTHVAMETSSHSLDQGRLDGLTFAAGIFTLVGTVYVVLRVPDFFIRFMLWMLTHTVYRIRIVGRPNVPTRGPALIVANHVSMVDGALVGATVQRFVRFMVYGPYFRLPLVQWLLQRMYAIPVTAGNRREVIAALERARAELAAGHVVCIFAEGAISRTGNLLPFQRGFERQVKDFLQIVDANNRATALVRAYHDQAAFGIGEGGQRLGQPRQCHARARKHDTVGWTLFENYLDLVERRVADHLAPLVALASIGYL